MRGERVYEFQFNDGRLLTGVGGSALDAYTKLGLGPAEAQKMVQSRDVTPRRRNSRLQSDLVRPILDIINDLGIKPIAGVSADRTIRFFHRRYDKQPYLTIRWSPDDDIPMIECFKRLREEGYDFQIDRSTELAT